MTKTCPGCGADAPSEARFCRHCGTTLRTTTGNVGGATISPLAATAPLVEQRGITSELDNGAPHSSTPLRTATEQELAATLLATPVQSESSEITIPVVRPTTTLQSGPDASAPGAYAPPSAELASPRAAPSAPISAALPTGGVSESRQAPEHRALRVWLVAGLIGALLLLCAGGAGAWLVLSMRRQTPAAAVSTDTPVVVAPPDAQQQAQAKLAEAQGLLAAGDPVAATARLREAVALDPANAETHRQLAQLLMESGARETAIEELRVVTRLEPNDKDAWRQLAEAQFAAGQYADAADSYRTLMNVSNEALADDRLQLAYANALRLAGRTNDAQALYRRLAASPLADVARTSKQRVKELSTATTTDTAANAPVRDAGTTAANNAQPTPASNTPAPTPPRSPAVPTPVPAALSPAEHYQRGMELWPANRAAAAAEFRAAAAAGNADAYYYLGLNLAEGRDPHALGRAELVSALEYFQRARASHFSAQARRYEDQLGQEFDRRRAK